MVHGYCSSSMIYKYDFLIDTQILSGYKIFFSLLHHEYAKHMADFDKFSYRIKGIYMI